MTNAAGNPVEPTLCFRGGRAMAALPIVFFVVWAVTISVAGAPDTRGLILGTVVGLAAGMFLVKGKWSRYAEEIFKGMSDPVGVVAIVAWFWAGMFANVLQVGGLVKGLAWLGVQAGVTGGGFVAVTFILAAVFATAVGTGYGTTVAFCTLMMPAGILLGADPVILFAAILSGAAFGDNLAPVSDTTIVSATTQDTDVPGVVRNRVKYALVAAAPAFVLFFILGGSSDAADLDGAVKIVEANTDPRGLLLLIPFVLVVFLALRGHHLLTSLTWGILVAIGVIMVASLAPGVAILEIDPAADAVKGALVDGIGGYVDMAALILLIVACSHIMRAGGAMGGVTGWLVARAGNSVARAEVSSWLIVAVLNVFITINTAAEIAAAPFVRQLGEKFSIHPYRRANFLDATTSALGYIFPWSGAVLIGYQTVSNLAETYPFVEVVEPTRVWPYVFHGWFLALVMLGAAVTGLGRIYVGKDGSPTKTRPQ